MPACLGRSGSDIRPAAPDWTGPGSDRRTSQAYDTTRVSLPRVTPAATGHGPDHPRTTGQHHSHSRRHSTGHNQTERLLTCQTRRPTRPARTALVRPRLTVGSQLLNSRLQVRVLPGAQQLSGAQHSSSSVAPSGGVERPGREDALRAIDPSACPRSWRTCGPRRLRRQSEPDLVATQGGATAGTAIP